VPLVDGDAGSWDDELNAAFGIIDEHDHAPGAGVQIPTVGININANLPMNGYGLTALSKLAFSQIAPPAGARTLYTSNVDNELYWLSNAGAAVKITSGAGLNLSLIGGIVGDYAAVGAEVAYDDANDRYTFKQQGAPKTWARLASGDVRLYETGTNENVYVGLKAPAALAAPYDVTWPLAAPASQVLVQIDAAGQLSCSNTLPVDTHITLSGVGRIKTGTRKRTQPFKPTYTPTGAMSISNNASGIGDFSQALGVAGTISYAQVDSLTVFDTVTGIVVDGTGLIGAGVGNCTYDLMFCRPSLGNAFTSILAAPVASAATLVTLTPNGGTYSPVNGDQLYVKVTLPGGGTYAFYAIEIVYQVT
jgi:hypothetical protein